MLTVIRRESAPFACAMCCALLLVNACSRSEPSHATPSTPSNPAIRPIDQAALDAAVRKVAAQHLAPGAVALVRTPSGTVTSVWGTRTFGGGEPITLADHFRIGSNTKTMTGTVILQLAQEGRLGIDDPVAKYRPGVPGGDKITIAHLLRMRSGLPNYSVTEKLNDTLDKEPSRAWRPDELLALAFASPTGFAPGTQYEYSNTNTVLLGLIAERLDGKPLARIFQDRLFTPHGLKNTSFPDTTSNAVPSPHPRGYMFGSNVETMKPLSAERQAAAAAGTFKPDDVTDENPSWGWSAGAGISTVGDLATWAERLGRGDVLNAEWHRRRLESILPTADGPQAPGYGYGIAKLGPFLGHTGELPGFNSFMGYDPNARVTLVVWTNLNAAPDAASTAPAVAIARTLIGIMYGSADGAAAPSGAGAPPQR